MVRYTKQATISTSLIHFKSEQIINLDHKCYQKLPWNAKEFQEECRKTLNAEMGDLPS